MKVEFPHRLCSIVLKHVIIIIANASLTEGTGNRRRREILWHGWRDPSDPGARRGLERVEEVVQVVEEVPQK